ncbi:MAG: bifunctional alpha/beta hydrolase/class I SAM-dependent methyltransferase, partial [Planctomycetota bacterium]
MVTLTKSAPERAATWTCTESKFRTWDGEDLFFRRWETPCSGQRCLVLFHGGHEHSGRFDGFVRELGLEDFTVFAWDARGHGESPGARGFAEHFQSFVKDAQAFLQCIERDFGFAPEDTVVLGHSVGSVIVSTWLHDYAPRVRAAILGSPAFRVKLYVPLALSGLRVLQKIRPQSHVNSYVRPGMLTHDKEEAEERRKDSLISPRISVRVLTSLFDTSERVIRGARSIQTPILLLSSGKDWVVHTSAHDEFYSRLPANGANHRKTYPDFYHEIFHEADRPLAISDARQFIETQFQSKLTDEAPRVDDAGVQLSLLQKLQFSATRAAMKSVGRLSEGIRIGWKRGFDSGSSLDYVYDDEARGWSPIGRLIDRTYLNAPGWKGIRTRREHLIESLESAVDEVLSRQDEVRIVDLAGGPGRYLQDILERRRDSRISVLCRDRDENGLREGQERARRRGIENIRYEVGDAFDADSVARIAPRADVVVVSGLWELFSDNRLLEATLEGISQLLPNHGSSCEIPSSVASRSRLSEKSSQRPDTTTTSARGTILATLSASNASP